jgi:hypothetical protein
MAIPRRAGGGTDRGDRVKLILSKRASRAHTRFGA